MKREDDEIVVPVVNEELHADAIPVETGGVRVTKHVDAHDEILEQELRKGRVEVKRVKTDRVVDGPQQVYRSGGTLIIPVVSEVLRVEKQWVVTEEIHITQLEERERVQQKVTVNQENATVERMDEQGNIVETVDPDRRAAGAVATAAAAGILERGPSIIRRPETEPAPNKKVLSSGRSMLTKAEDRKNRR